MELELAAFWGCAEAPASIRAILARPAAAASAALFLLSASFFSFIFVLEACSEALAGARLRG